MAVALAVALLETSSGVFGLLVAGLLPQPQQAAPWKVLGLIPGTGSTLPRCSGWCSGPECQRSSLPTWRSLQFTDVAVALFFAVFDLLVAGLLPQPQQAAPWRVLGLIPGTSSTLPRCSGWCSGPECQRSSLPTWRSSLQFTDVAVAFVLALPGASNSRDAQGLRGLAMNIVVQP